MADRPDILLLFSDQHGRIAGCYGDPVVRTPHIDRLAAEGVTFDAAYCPSPICLPSRMSLLTGRMPHSQSCWTNTDVLSSGIPTYAHALGAAGYDAVLVGRLHSVGPDQTRGFRVRDVGDHSTNWVGGRAHDLGPLHRTNDPWRESLAASGPGGSAYEAHDHDVTDAAIARIREIGARRAKGDRTPFALTVGWLLPHAPYVCSPELYASYAGRVPPPRLSVPEDEHTHHTWWRHDRGIADATEEEVNRARTAYYGLVTALDAMVGRVLEALEAAGLAGNACAIYTSDHGDHIGERGLWWKQSFYEESAGVPLVVRWPGRAAAGERRREVVNLTDLTETLIAIAGAPALPGSEGRSLVPLLVTGGAPWLDETVSEYVNDGIPAWSGGRMVVSRMVRSGQWKLVYHHGHPAQLFDLEADPDELRDLAADPSHAGVLAALTARVLADWDPEDVIRRVERHKAEQAVLAAWARAVDPPEVLRWEMKPEQNWLAANAAPGGEG